MYSYENLIYEKLKGNTPREKFENLEKMQKLNEELLPVSKDKVAMQLMIKLDNVQKDLKQLRDLVVEREPVKEKMIISRRLFVESQIIPTRIRRELVHIDHEGVGYFAIYYHDVGNRNGSDIINKISEELATLIAEEKNFDVAVNKRDTV